MDDDFFQVNSRVRVLGVKCIIHAAMSKGIGPITNTNTRRLRLSWSAWLDVALFGLKPPAA